MRWIVIVLVGLLSLFQYQLWRGEGGLLQKAKLEHRVEQQIVENQQLEKRNQQLAGEVSGLRDGLEGIEERARRDLGMVRDGETYYMVIEPDITP